MKRHAFFFSTAAAIVATRGSLLAAGRMRVLWLERDGAEARVPFTRDGSFVYLPGFDSLCWLLRDIQAPPETGYVSMSIDLIQTLYEVQQELGGSALIVRQGFCKQCTVPEPSDLREQHRVGLAVDVEIGFSASRMLVARGLVRQSDVFRGHVHIAALRDRWQQMRIST